MKSLDFIYSILSEIDAVVLKRLAPGEYKLVGKVPRFYSELYPGDENGACITPWQYSDMLALFLDDAEIFFKKGKPGRFSSTTWQEEGVDGDKALFAQAISTDEGQAIVLHRFHEPYIERVRLLQKARENILERRELKRNRELYEKISRYDALTRLYNHATFLEILKAEVLNARNTGTHLSLLIMDIDDFGSVNDLYGHLAGDAVLTEFGKILQSYLRSGDTAARYGGEEFAVLATHTNQQQAYKIAENLRKRVEDFCFPRPERLTISIGCTTFLPTEDEKDFIQRADFALYDAKRSGKNNVKFR